MPLDEPKAPASGGPAREPILLGHRGAPHLAPENTLESFRRAMEVGAAGFEFDVRSSGDGHPVVIHDAVVPAGGGPRRRVSTSPAAALRLPLLEDVLREFGGAWLDLELKVVGLEGRVLELVTRYLTRGRFVITSFHLEVLREIKRLAPETPVGLLMRRSLARWPPASGGDLDFLAPHYTLITHRLCQDARSHGLGLITWTVNTSSAMRRMQTLGVDVVITDYPDRFAGGDG